jgi:DNA-binding CsgD family transcriptional regulator
VLGDGFGIPWLTVVGFLLTAAWLIGSTGAWLDTLGKMELSEIPSVSIASYAAHSLLLIPINAASAELLYCCTLIIAPILSSIAVAALARHPRTRRAVDSDSAEAARSARDGEASASPLGERAQGDKRRPTSVLSEPPRGILLWGLAFLVFTTIVTRAMPVPPEQGVILGGSGLMTNLTELAVSGLMYAMCCAREWSNALETRLFALIAVALSVGFFLAIVLSSGGAFYYKRFIVGSIHCLTLFLFDCLAITCRGRRLSPILAGATFAGLYLVLPQFLANLLVSLAFSSMDYVARSEKVDVVAALGLLLICVATISLLVSKSNRDQREEARRREQMIERACSHISQTWGLSDREGEVVKLIYRGMSAQEIADELSIAESTVKTHTKHAYVKIGVHTRQELYQLVSSYLDN